MGDHEATTSTTIRGAIAVRPAVPGYVEVLEQNLMHYAKLFGPIVVAALIAFRASYGHGNSLFVLLSIAIAVAAAANEKWYASLKFWVGVLATVAQAVLAIVGADGRLADLTPTDWSNVGLAAAGAIWTVLIPNAAQFTQKVIADPNGVYDIASAGVPDPQQLEPRAPASVGADLREGMAWVYQHPYLAPYALCLHVWFIANAIAGTVYIFHATSLGLDGAAVGLTLGVAGLAGVLGAGLAEWAARLLGTGKAILLCDYLTGAGWLLVALAPQSDLTLYALIAAQIFYGIGFGLRGPLEMSFRNAVTPSRLRGRMNTTIRSINWGLIAVAAPFGGWLALQFGDRTALAIAGTMMLGTGTVLLLSRFRSASMPTDASA